MKSFKPNLLPVLPFIEGETLSGYVSRLAQLHGTTPRDLCSDLGMRWPNLCSGHEDQLERLAWLTGEPFKRLKAHRTVKLDIGRYQIAKAIATTGILRRTSVRLCPKCVSEALQTSGPQGVFQRLEWTVNCLHICPYHCCHVIELPAGKYTHSTYDFVSRVLDHIEEVKLASQNTGNFSPTVFEHYIRNRLYYGWQSDWLQTLDLCQIHRASLTLGAPLDGYRDNRYLNDISVEQERQFCQTGFARLMKGPDEFKSALLDLYGAGDTERPYYSSDLGAFYYWL